MLMFMPFGATRSTSAPSRATTRIVWREVLAHVQPAALPATMEGDATSVHSPALIFDTSPSSTTVPPREKSMLPVTDRVSTISPEASTLARITAPAASATSPATVPPPARPAVSTGAPPETESVAPDATSIAPADTGRTPAVDWPYHLSLRYASTFLISGSGSQRV